MKDWARKLDIVGILILAGVFLADRITGIWAGWMTILAVVGGVSVLAAIVARWDEIRAGLGRRSARYGANSLTSIVLLLGVLTLANYLGSEHSSRWDLTTEKRFSLSEQSHDILDQLVEDVHIRAFYSGDNPTVEDLLKLYAGASPRISFELIDPDVQPQLASQYDVTVYGASRNPLTGESFSFGTLILDMAGRTERIESETEPLGEQDLTNAVIKLAKGETKTIYFIEGHGEKQVSDTERSGMATARGALERENYRVESLNLVRVEAVPEDAAVLVWPGPEVEPLGGEVDLVDAWLNMGGSLMVMVDPAPDGAGLGELLGRWSVSVGDDFVVDVSGLGQLFGTGPEVPLATESDYASDHPITEGFRVTTLFPMVRSVRPEQSPGEGLQMTELISTSPQSWSETELGAESVRFDEGSDVRGPVPIGLAITKAVEDDKAARLVVIGDSDFAANGFFGALGNGDLFLNAVSWLAADEGFISIRPHEPEDRPLTLTQAGATLAYYLTIVLFPLSVLVTGVSVWARRRRQ